MRFQLITPDQIQVRESMGLVKDIYDPLSTIRQPLSDYRVMLDLIKRDPTLAAAYDIIVDFTTHRGYDFIGGTKEERDKYRKIFEKLDFKRVLTNLVYTLCYYGDAFMELRTVSGVVSELYVLETTEMRIDYDIHGKVRGYVQRQFSTQGLTEEQIKEREGTPENPNMGVFFAPDEVIHFRMKWIGNQVYSYNPNESISTVASTRLYAGNYLMNIFINMPPRYVAHLAGIGSKDYETAKAEFQSAKTNYKKTIAFSKSSDPNSKLNLQKIDPPYDEKLIAILKWLDKQILKITRVPKSWIEESDVENRGVTESIQRPFDVRIQAIHRNVLEPMINSILLPGLGNTNDKLQIRFNEISKKGEMEILQNAGLLRDMGLKPEALVRYLDERGILGTDPSDFEETQLKKNMELNPSRKRMDASMDDMTQNRNERGVSEESAAKMEI